jgi:hypothetical protein
VYEALVASGAQLVPAFVAAAPAAFQTAIDWTMQGFADPTNANYKNVDPVVAALSQNYGLLTQ